MAVTEVQHEVTGSGDKTHEYGTIPTFASNISIDDEDILEVYLNGVLLTLTSDYTVDESTETITLTASTMVEAQDIVTIRRSVEIDSPYVDFTNNTTIDEADLDLAILQLLYKLQELDNDVNDLIEYDSVNTYWDGRARKTGNFLPATSSDGLVTKAQMDNAIAGADVATVSDVFSTTRSGTGSQVSFTIASFPTEDTDDSSLMVTVSGVMQTPTTDYSVSIVGGRYTVAFVTAPPSGTNNILFRLYKGTVAAVFDDNSVDGSAIIDGTLDPDALDAGAGSGSRFIVFNTSGTPVVSTITGPGNIVDFNSDVRANRLDQMAAPTANVSLNSNKITNLTAGGAGTTDACNVAQMESYVAANTSSSVAGSVYGMEPYDTDGSAKFTTSLTSQTLTGLTAGTYLIHVHTDGQTGTSTVTAGGVTRETTGSGPSVSFYVTTATTSIAITSSNCNIRNISYMRVA